MSPADALEVITMLSVRFPGQVPKETGAVWASDLALETGLLREDGLEAAALLAKKTTRPFYSDFVAACREAGATRAQQQRVRYETQTSNVLHLPARTTCNPRYPRAAMRLILWIAEEKAAGRTASEAECGEKMEQLLRGAS